MKKKWIWIFILLMILAIVFFVLFYNKGNVSNDKNTIDSNIDNIKKTL